MPRHSTVSPALTALQPALPSAPVRACQAVTPAHGRQAASSSLRCSGTGTTAAAGTFIVSLSVPSRGPPRVVRTSSLRWGPAIHPWAKIGVTRRPGSTPRAPSERSTPAPRATISPTPSEQGIRGRGCLGLYCPWTISRSR